MAPIHAPESVGRGGILTFGLGTLYFYSSSNKVLTCWIRILIYGNKAIDSKPAFSGNPHMRFMFWTA